MKLLSQSSKYLSIFILLIIAIWSSVFYFFMLETIHDSIDEELENHKRLIIKKVAQNENLLNQKQFDIGHFSIHQTSKEKALSFTDVYKDAVLPMQDGDDPFPEMEPVRILVTVFKHDEKYYKLKIVNSMIEEDDLAKDLFFSLVILYILFVTSVIVVNNIVLKKLWKPFYSLLHQLKNFRLDAQAELPQIQTNTQEFNDLRTSLDTLLTHSKKAYQQQQEFIENASHELRTPLAIVIGKMELLLEKNELSLEQAKEIDQILHITERMTRLNKSLLLLTKIKNKQFFDNKTVDFNAIVKQNIQNLEDFSAFNQQTIQLEEKTSLTIDVDTGLSNIIAINLIKNAIAHSASNSVIEVQIKQNSFIVSNVGNKPLNVDKVFSRFYKSNENSNGTGLGLSIVKAICDLYHFKITYRFEQKKHIFQINFS